MKLSFDKLRVPFCALSGALTALSFTFEGLWGISFFSLVPLIIACLTDKTRKKRRIVLNLMLFSFFFYPILLHWLYPMICTHSGTTPFISRLLFAGGMIFICLIMGAYFSLALIMFQKLKKGTLADVIFFSFMFIFAEWLQEVLYPAAFPWGRLASIVTPFTSFIQSASILGSLFVSLLIVIINGSIAYALINIKNKKRFLSAVGLAAGIFAANTLFGMTVSSRELDPQLDVTMIQGNFSGDVKWETSAEEILDTYIELTEKNITSETELVIYSETAIPLDFFMNDDYRKRIISLAVENRVTIIIGILWTEGSLNYNSMIAVNPDGSLSNIYNKQKLVPVGEYIPCRSIFGGLAESIFERSAEFEEGEKPYPLYTDMCDVCPIICYESIFPSIAREAVKQGGEYIAVGSNDSWFGTSIALYQHHSQSILRAVENRRYLLRCSSTGITSIISPYGEITATVPKLERCALNGKFDRLTGTTLYNRIGDIIIVPSVIFILMGIICGIKQRKSESRTEGETSNNEGA